MGSHRRLDLGAAGMAGRARLLDSDLTLEAVAAVLAEDGLTTSAIEGERFAPDVLRSSVARHLGLPTAGLPEAPRAVDGLVEVLLDATQRSTSVGQEPASTEASGEVQERGVTRVAPGLFGGETGKLGTLSTGVTSGYPGEFAIRTPRGYYFTAANGGGRAADPTVFTGATSAGAWEKFKLAIASPPSPHDKTFQTKNGNFVTAVNGGGMAADALHTDATQARDWERF